MSDRTLLGPDGVPLAPAIHANTGSALVSRKILAGRAGQSFNGARDLYETLGYPLGLTPEDYVDAYLRQDIAARIVDAYPDATWREAPKVNGPDEVREAFGKLDARLHIWRALHRADRLAGLGHYGVLLLGLDGGQPMDQPVRGNRFTLLYLQPHSERTAQIVRWEDNPKSPRFGRPLLYRITSGVNWTGAGAGQKSFIAHHSRVIHIAERALEDESIGTPRLERVWNRLMDLDKLLGGSAEMYWQNVAMLMHLKADLEVKWDPDEAEALKAQVEEMQHGLRRWLRTRGVDASNIAPGLQGADPANHIDKQLDMIAGATGIPKRILIGSEAGELASSQDENNFVGRVEERREQFAGPSIAMPFLTRCTELGILPPGADGIAWPENDTLGEVARAEIAEKNAQAIATYANAPGAELIVSPAEFRETLGYKAAQPKVAEDDDLGAEGVIQFNAARHV
ncbi:DUF1073 domain-containing protein [Rhodovulum sulfidophilum]|nr:DUF1073 domain-containing protein [Rhodovulum sulfidophilum]